MTYRKPPPIGWNPWVSERARIRDLVVKRLTFFYGHTGYVRAAVTTRKVKEIGSHVESGGDIPERDADTSAHGQQPLFDSFLGTDGANDERSQG